MLPAGGDTRRSRPQRVTHLRCQKTNGNKTHTHTHRLAQSHCVQFKAASQPFFNVPSLTFREVFGEAGLLAVPKRREQKPPHVVWFHPLDCFHRNYFTILSHPPLGLRGAPLNPEGLGRPSIASHHKNPWVSTTSPPSGLNQ